MGEVIASPAVRAYAGAQGHRHRDTGAGNRPRDDRARGRRAKGRRRHGAAGGRDPVRDYWDVDHAAYGPVEEEPLSRFARIAAENLAAAQALIPAVTHHDRADMRAIECLRTRLKAEAAERDVKLTALAFHACRARAKR